MTIFAYLKFTIMKNFSICRFCIVIFTLLTLVGCKKDPQIGSYLGTFTGSYTDNNTTRDYTSFYSFKITKSNDKEIVIQELSSNTSSTLKKINDSIVGSIGFANIYNPNGGSGHTFNALKIRGQYMSYKEKSLIEGTFSGLVYLENSTTETSGTFTLVQQ